MKEYDGMPEVIGSGTLQFKVHGEFITKFFRRLYREGQELDIVIKKLQNSIVDLPEDIAKSIILGHKKLTGINDLVLESDTEVVTTVKEDMTRKKYHEVVTKENFYTYSDAWIMPDGTMFACGVQEHISTIWTLYEFGVIEEATERDVEKAGWLKLSSGEFRYRSFYDDKELRKKPMTKALMTFIYDYAFENELSEIKVNGFPVPMKGIFDYLDKWFGDKK